MSDPLDLNPIKRRLIDYRRVNRPTADDVSALIAEVERLRENRAEAERLFSSALLIPHDIDEWEHDVNRWLRAGRVEVLEANGDPK